MKKRKKFGLNILMSFLLIPILIAVPMRVSGAVGPITEMEEKLEGISEEEKKALEELFTLSQKISKMEQEETEITAEITTLQQQIDDLIIEIEDKQEDYDLQLEILEQVLVNYQREGPTSYLEILLSAENLTTFLKSINLIKDISRNVGELLDSLEEGKKDLQTQKDSLDSKILLVAQRKVELQENLDETQILKHELEEYLVFLQEEQTDYQDQLNSLTDMWDDCTVIFSEISSEIIRVIGEGYFTLADLNLTLGFTSMQGAINGDSFNNIINENTTLPETTFYFGEDQVVIEVPEKHLVLNGKFVVAGESSIRYEVEAGTFYDIQLEKASIEELFRDGPLLIDFKTISGELVIIDFTLNWIKNEEGQLAFEINPIW